MISKSLVYLSNFVQEFLLELVTRGDMHHIVDEQTVDDIIVTIAFHEYRLLAIHGRVTILFHPCGNVQVPSPRGLLRAIDDFEK